MKRKHRLTSHYTVLKPDGGTEIWKSKDFWDMAFDAKHQKNKSNMGYLVSEYEFSEDWKSWENHPNGDEMVYCVSGELTFILQEAGTTRRVSLTTGAYLIVPKNTWHTAKVKTTCKVLFMTWGFGTQHKEI